VALGFWLFSDNARVHGEPNDREESFGAPDDQITPLVALIWTSAQTILLSSQLRAAIYPIQAQICRKSHEVNVLSKFSFGPSQEDEGQKKTVHSTEGSYLAPHHVCSIERAPAQRCKSRATTHCLEEPVFYVHFTFMSTDAVG
jgi:hypothetical protein